MSNSLQEKKWQKLLERAWLFRLVPFIDFVLVAGSMAMGTAKEDSDFDVIVGCRQGRIFTARFSCWFVFSLFGSYAKHSAAGDDSNGTHKAYQSHKSYSSYKDKFCFSHFVTPAAYRLSPPHDNYCQLLFSSLVPIFGNPEIIQKFFDANKDWNSNVVPRQARELNLVLERAKQVEGLPLRKLGIIKMKEWFLNGYFGDLLERFLRRIQVNKIEKGLADVPKNNPRIIFNDNELEFHPYTKSI